MSLTSEQVDVPPILEVTFLRRDRLDQGAKQIPVRLPHPLDVQLNVQTRPPVFLGDWWRGRTPDAGEVALMLSAQNSYLRQNIMKLQQAVVGLEARQTLMTEALVTLHKQRLEGESRDRPDLSDLQDVAAGKPYTLSSSRAPQPPVGIVQAQKPFFFHTQNESRPDISIDLGEVHAIEWIRIGNRTDTAQERANGLFLRLGLLKEGDGPLLPVLADQDFLSRVPAPCLMPFSGQKARFVTLIGSSGAPLHLSEIAVFARPQRS